MATDAFIDWYVHTVDVDTVTGVDYTGAATVETHTGVTCWVEDKIQLVRDQGGQETVSTATLWCPLDDRGKFTPGSLVHIDGRESIVIALATGDSATGDDLDGIAVMLA